MYISLTSGRPDPSSFKTPIQIATNTEIEGLQTNGITNANLYAMIEIFFFSDSEYVLWDESDTIVNKDDSTST